MNHEKTIPEWIPSAAMILPKNDGFSLHHVNARIDEIDRMLARVETLKEDLLRLPEYHQ